MQAQKDALPTFAIEDPHKNGVKCLKFFYIRELHYEQYLKKSRTVSIRPGHTTVFRFRSGGKKRKWIGSARAAASQKAAAPARPHRILWDPSGAAAVRDAAAAAPPIHPRPPAPERKGKKRQCGPGLTLLHHYGLGSLLEVVIATHKQMKLFSNKYTV